MERWYGRKVTMEEAEEISGIDEVEYIYELESTLDRIMTVSYTHLDVYKRQLLREGDVLTVYSIDRLGRNYTEIMKQWQYITQEIKADIRVLDMPLPVSYTHLKTI